MDGGREGGGGWEGEEWLLANNELGLKAPERKREREIVVSTGAPGSSETAAL